MTVFNFLSMMSFSPTEKLIIIVVSIALAVFIALNILLVVYIRKHRERKLCTEQLQRKREELLAELAEMRSDQDIDEQESAEEQSDDELAEDDEDDEDEDSESVVAPEVTSESAAETVDRDPSQEPSYDILAVKDMTGSMRVAFGFEGVEYDRKRYYVRYRYGFEAKLTAASDEVKERYKAIVDAAKGYKGVKIRNSFAKQRITKGNRTLAVLLFRGKTLCIAFALDPADYADTKFRGIDKSDKKRFQKTPLLYKLSSDRRTKYAEIMLAELAAKYVITALETHETTEFDLRERSTGELFDEKKLRIFVLGEAPELDEEDGDDLIDDVDDDESDEIEDEETETVDEETTAAAATSLAAEIQNREILAVRDMTGAMREKFGLEGEEYDGKSYYVRYRYGFEAKLTAASDEVKERYKAVVYAAKSYKGVKVRCSFGKQRITKGNKTLAVLLFRGKTLCIAFALDPAKYAETKYRGIDKSDKKRFQKTPLLYKLSSERRTRYAEYMLSELAFENGLEILDTPERIEYDFTEISKGEMFDRKQLQIKILGEVSNSDGELPEHKGEGRKKIAVPSKHAPAEEHAEELPERDFDIFSEVAVSEADVLSDEKAKELVEAKTVVIARQKKTGKGYGIVNIDVLSKIFAAGDVVDLEKMREKGIISKDVGYVKVLANGILDKPLVVEADEFSLTAVKMIVLTGGRVIRRNVVNKVK